MMEMDELIDSAHRAFGANGLDQYPAACWNKLTDMGWFMMMVPESDGGLGLGWDAMAVIQRELGRSLASGAGLAQMMAVYALSHAEKGPLRDDFLVRAMAGEAITASLQMGEDASPRTGIADADQARHAMVVQPDRIAIYNIAAAVHRPTWDATRRLFDVTVGDETLCLASGPDACALANQLKGFLALALAADAIGGSQALLDITVDYVQTRRQFDRPLAAFQALKHRLADMKTALVAAEALLWARARAQSLSSPDLLAFGAVKTMACQTYLHIAEQAIQLHGGIGLTEEYPAHLYFKRAFLNEELGGSARHWTKAIGTAALAAAA